MFIARLVIALALAFLVNANAAETYRYGFSFDLRSDEQHAEALDYQYRHNDEVLVGVQKPYVAAGRVFATDSEGGDFPPGTSLYFRWRDTRTQLVYEETAKFDGQLVGDLTGCELTLLIIDNHLHVYLVRQVRRMAQKAAVGPQIYRDLNVSEVYPRGLKSIAR